MITTIKTCFKCNESKPLSEFYKHAGMKDGHLGKCKTCTKDDVSDNRLHKAKYYQEYERSRSNNPDRVEARRVYAQTPEGKEAQRRAHAKHKQRFPDKHRARSAVHNALRDGKLQRKTACEVCLNDGRLEAHHDDYSKPLDVRWLCSACHKQHHAEFRRTYDTHTRTDTTHRGNIKS